MNDAKNVVILGSTGSVGKSALEVIAASNGALRAIGLSAHSNVGLLEEQAREVKPRWVVATDEAAARKQDWSRLDKQTETLFGADAVEKLVRQDEVDIVLAAIVGSAGLRGAWAALDAGKTLALANKETLVVAGQLVMELARERGAAILPVDSEHSAIFQALQAGRRDELKRIILTASGGPFRALPLDQLAHVTVADALEHPTWDMGPKITIDSATMMNKALEIVEARWLFDLRADQIAVMIHPQSVVHSLVEFVDGSVVAQLSPPDMRLPIQYALTYPRRTAGIAERIDWTAAQRWTFDPPDLERFPAIALGLEAAERGGTCGAALNGANEAAVAAFLAGELKFTEIVPAVRSVLHQHEYDPRPSLDALMAVDQWARKELVRWAST